MSIHIKSQLRVWHTGFNYLNHRHINPTRNTKKMIVLYQVYFFPSVNIMSLHHNGSGSL